MHSVIPISTPCGTWRFPRNRLPPIRNASQHAYGQCRTGPLRSHHPPPRQSDDFLVQPIAFFTVVQDNGSDGVPRIFAPGEQIAEDQILEMRPRRCGLTSRVTEVQDKSRIVPIQFRCLDQALRSVSAAVCMSL